MAKIKKKGTSGAAKTYLTRTQAVKKLQVSLANFRRLCIFKGIYPREPRNRKKVRKSATHSTTFYYAKDIQYLLHEPVLQKFREHKIFAKKLKRALGRGEFSTAKRLEEGHAPRITLDHIIKERYPTFTDALRDLDDALSMLHLFAILPASQGVPATTTAECERLCNEFQHYIIRTHALRKSFLSIKGIYYQAEIQGQDILWLIPYKFAQHAPADVDYRIMKTFVDFYTTLLGFVLFRLYTIEGLVYPPKFDTEADAKGAGLRAFQLESKGVKLLETGSGTKGKDVTRQVKTLGDKLASLAEEDKNEVTENSVIIADENEEQVRDDVIDKFEPIDGAIDILPQPSGAATGSSEPSTLFSNFTFFLSRETPREPIEFILRSFGCKRIGWDAVLGDGAFTENELDPLITHQVVDRPPQYMRPAADEDEGTPGTNLTSARGGRVLGRIYVQPQYVWDCINAGKILRPDAYSPGAILPPHLSPWIKPGEGGYDPTAPLPDAEHVEENEDEEVQAIENGNENQEKDKEEDENETGSHHGMDTLDNDEDQDHEESTGEENASKKKSPILEVMEDESEDEEELAARQHQAELEAETAGKPIPKIANPKKKGPSKREREEAEAKEMVKVMMPKKKRKLYEKMVYGNKKKEAEVQNLVSKRRKLEKEKKKEVDPKSDGKRVKA